jgi:uncharacterized protein YdaL
MSEDDYEVGYGKPPKATQFKKGQSGNPSGKKKPASLEDILKRTLAKQVTVTVDGKKQSLPMMEVIIQALVRKAATGDLAAIKTVVQAAAAFTDESVAEATLSPHQLEALKDILATMETNDGA